MPENMLPNGKACILVSGGVESSVLLWDALNRYESVVPMYVHNHLRWEEVELFWLKRLLRNIKSDKVKPLKVIDANMKDIYGGHWSITGIKIPDSASRSEAVYLPGRNIIFLSKAACIIHKIPPVENCG